MATTPVVPAPISTVAKDITWIRGHVIAVLLIVALIVGGIFGGISLVENLEERHDARVAANDLKKNGVDTAAQQALVNELAQEHADNLARDAQQTALIQSLAAQLIASRAATAKQVATDQTLTVNDAASRLAQQTKAGPGDVTVSNNDVILSLPITRNIVADLDQLTQAQSDVTNLSGQLQAQSILTSDAKIELQTASQVIAADKTELISTIKSDNAACVASTKIAVDAEAKKGRKRGFWAVVAAIAGTALLLK